MPLERRLQVVEAYVRRQTGREVCARTIGFSDLSRTDMVGMSRVLNAGTGEFPVVFVGDDVACAGGYDLSAIVTCATAQTADEAIPPPTAAQQTKESPHA